MGVFAHSNISVDITLGCRRANACSELSTIHPLLRQRGFYTHYQVDRGNQSDDTEPEPHTEEELRHESAHSLFGMIFQLASITGWTVEYIRDRISWQMLVLMLEDAPRYVKREKKGGAEPTGECQDTVSLFRSFEQKYLQERKNENQ